MYVYMLKTNKSEFTTTTTKSRKVRPTTPPTQPPTHPQKVTMTNEAKSTHLNVGIRLRSARVPSVDTAPHELRRKVPVKEAFHQSTQRHTEFRRKVPLKEAFHQSTQRNTEFRRKVPVKEAFHQSTQRHTEFRRKVPVKEVGRRAQCGTLCD